MQPDFKEIKLAAKSSLKSRWAEAISLSLGVAILMLLDLFFQEILMTIFKVDAVWSLVEPTTLPNYSAIPSVCITVFSAVYCLFVVTPFAFGVMRWFWHITSGKDVAMKEAFYYFSSGKQFFKVVLVSLGLFLRLAVAVVICFMPYILLTLLTTPDIYNYFGYAMPINLSGLNPLASLAEFIGFFYFAFWATRYALVFVPMMNDESLSASKIFKETLKLARHRAIRTLAFLLSFIDWVLLSVLFVPLIYVLPFGLASLTVYGREELREKQRLEKEKEMQNRWFSPQNRAL